MEIALWLVVIVICVVAVAALAERWQTSAPLLLVLVGIAASFVPFLPEVALEPELVLVGILPPLLFSAAYNTSFIDFRAKKGTIASLSVGLVIFTTLIVGLVAWWLIPDIPLAAGSPSVPWWLPGCGGGHSDRASGRDALGGRPGAGGREPGQRRDGADRVAYRHRCGRRHGDRAAGREFPSGRRRVWSSG